MSCNTVLAYNRYLKDQHDMRSAYVFRESMLAISYVKELWEIRKNAYKKLKI